MRAKTVYLHCKSSNDLESVFHFILSIFLEIRRTWVAYQRIYRKEPSNRFKRKFLSDFTEATVAYNVFPRILKMK